MILVWYDVMLMIWIGIWTFFVERRFRSTFDGFHTPFLFPLRNALYWTRWRKKPPFCDEAKAHVHWLLRWSFVSFVRCVHCTTYLYTLILHITDIMYWLPQTFVVIAEKRKNHTTSTIALPFIRTREKRRLVYSAELSCACVCMHVWKLFWPAKEIFIKNCMWMCAFIGARCVHTQCETYLFIEFGFISAAFVDAPSLVVENFMKNDGDFLYWI